MKNEAVLSFPTSSKRYGEDVVCFSTSFYFNLFQKPDFISINITGFDCRILTILDAGSLLIVLHIMLYSATGYMYAATETKTELFLVSKFYFNPEVL